MRRGVPSYRSAAAWSGCQWLMLRAAGIPAGACAPAAVPAASAAAEVESSLMPRPLPGVRTVAWPSAGPMSLPRRPTVRLVTVCLLPPTSAELHGGRPYRGR